jgi:replication factor C subunit 3/5
MRKSKDIEHSGDLVILTLTLGLRSDQISEKTPIPPPDWEALIEVIAKEMIEERSPARILQVRAKLYDLLTHCIPATTILKVG